MRKNKILFYVVRYEGFYQSRDRYKALIRRSIKFDEDGLMTNDIKFLKLSDPSIDMDNITMKTSNNTMLFSNRRKIHRIDTEYDHVIFAIKENGLNLEPYFPEVDRIDKFETLEAGELFYETITE